MKITENEVEVVKHQSVIVPLLLFLFAALGRTLFFFPSSSPASPLSARRYELKLTGCCLRLQKKKKNPPLRFARRRNG